MIDIQESKISGMIFAKAILVIMKNIETGEEIIKPVVDKAFKNFGKTWE